MKRNSPHAKKKLVRKALTKLEKRRERQGVFFNVMQRLRRAYLSIIW